jgi:hypothetical protein
MQKSRVAGKEHRTKAEIDPCSYREATEAGQECLQAALEYLSWGLSSLAVCPPDHGGVGETHSRNCKSPGKAPWGRWKEFQTRLPTEAELGRKWSDNPHLNVGVALGGVTDLIGLDVDQDGGEELLQRLSNGDLPPTLEFTSGKGRRLLYRVPKGVTLRPTPKPGGEELENGELRLLGLGSQTVMPPSRHVSGRRYKWTPGHRPGEIEPPIAPVWVIELMRADARNANGKATNRQAGKHADGEKIREGSRNSTLASLAGSMRRRGMTERSIRAALKEENETRCDPPLDEVEVDGIARSIAGYDPARTESTAGNGGPYRISGGCIVHVKLSRDGVVEVPLCNFTARIVEEVLHDDGAEQTLSLALEGSLADSRALARTEASAAEFAAMNWVIAAWGSRAVISAGMGCKDHLRAAIQHLSGEPPRRTVYQHTGWRELAGSWIYVHAGGALGADGPGHGIDVSLPTPLAGYALPAPPDGEPLREAVRASLHVLGLAPDRITVPLLAAVYRSALDSTDMTVHLTGPTGTGKTELAALAQQHYGAGMDARHLPGSWSSTGNSLEGLAFAAKDALLVVDDFAPGGSIYDVSRYHREADRLLRAQGNRSGRGRMRPDGDPPGRHAG